MSDRLGYGRLGISPRLRHEILDEHDRCYYCGQLWGASDVDHLVPVVVGGLTVRDNLVGACTLCNTQKRSMSVADWRDWRAEHGMSWPPEARSDALSRILPLLAPDDLQAFSDALQRRPMAKPLDDALYKWSRRVHRAQCGTDAEELAILVAAARESVAVAS